MVATDLSVLFVASVFGKHHGFEQVVVRCGHLIGAGSMVIADGDRRLAAASAWIEIKDRDSVSRSGIAACRPDGVFQRVGAVPDERIRRGAGNRTVRLGNDLGLWSSV
jgi:hypothetical protein